VKRLLFVVTLGLVVTFGWVPQQVANFSDDFAPTLVAQEDPARITVYITRTGEKYHRDGCRYLSRSKIPVSLKEAVSRGYGPCSVCKPPTIARAK
jgi:hypothetical protein